MKALIVFFICIIVSSASQAGWKDWLPWGKTKPENSQQAPTQEIKPNSKQKVEAPKSNLKQTKSNKPLPDVPEANYKNQIVCYFSLLSHAKGENKSINNGMILVAGEKKGQEGFYLYSPKISYFCSLPSSPMDSNKQYDLYYFKLEIPQKDTMYMTYGLAKGNQPGPFVAGSLAPSSEAKDKYIDLQCVGDTSPNALANFNKELLARVQTVHEQYKKHADYMKKAYKKEVTADKPKAALKACFPAGKSVKAMAIKELSKF
ncbi:MAG: hypothetical protein KDD33_03430 [Bdellovibrionales bacterium]|nr:hypothetical protein [Bdellovibrionales bacterium]